MADDTRKRPPPAPPAARAPAAPEAPPPAPADQNFSPDAEAAKDDDWESDLAAWDAALPISGPLPSGLVERRASATTARATTAAAATTGQVRGLVDAAPGALPEDENPFFETPTTVVSPDNPLFDGPDDAVPTAQFDEGGAAPASGSYAALITIDENAETVFDRDPPAEEPASLPPDVLPEMAPEAWRARAGRLVGPGADVVLAPRDPDDWRRLAALVAEERAVAPDRPRVVDLALAAGRVAEALGRPDDALAHIEEAIAVDAQARSAGVPIAGAAAVAHRARLVLKERAGAAGEPAAQDSLARLGSMAHPDQPYYRALYAERLLDAAAAGAADAGLAGVLAAIPAGLPRELAEAEAAWRQRPIAAAHLETGGRRAGGGLGAALLACAADVSEAARLFPAAAAQRRLAATLDARAPVGALGRVRDLVRSDAGANASAAAGEIEDLLARLPPSSLKVALARWGAALARRGGDGARAWRFLAEPAALGPMSAALARDRLDAAVLVAGAARPPGAILAVALMDAIAAFSHPIARACLAASACEIAADAGGELARDVGADSESVAVALASAENAADAVPDAAWLAPALESLSARADNRQARLRALRLWRRMDPARWVAASLDLADALAAAPDASVADVDGAAAADAVLDEITAAEPRLPVFWPLAARARRRGRWQEASARLAGGAAAWADSPLGPALAELSAEVLARADLPAACDRLQAAARDAGAHAKVELTARRALRRLGDRARWLEHVGQAPKNGDARGEGRARRAAALVEPLFWGPAAGSAGGEGAGSAEVAAGSGAPVGATAVGLAAPELREIAAQALEAAPSHPAMLALAFAAGVPAAELGDRVAAAAKAAPAGSMPAAWAFLPAMAWAAAGDAGGALARAAEALAPSGAFAESSGAGVAGAAGCTVRRLSWAAANAEAKGRLLLLLAAAPSADAAAILEAGEAEEQAGRRAVASLLYRRAAGAAGAGALASDLQAGMARVTPGSRGALPGAALASPAAVVSRGRDRLAALETAAREARLADVVEQLVSSPPHEEVAQGDVLALAALIAEARLEGPRADELAVQAARALAEATSGQGDDGGAIAASVAGPVVAAVVASMRAGARPSIGVDAAGATLDALARGARRLDDGASAALWLVEAARLATKPVGAAAPDAPAAPDARAAPDADALVEIRLRDAVASDPGSAPAAIAWRRFLAAERRAPEAAAAAAAEAEALRTPALRVRALLRAAALALLEVGVTGAEIRAGAAAGAPAVANAVGHLRRALDIAPHDLEAFTRLRDLCDASGQDAALAELLGVRLAATTNPFEVTTLHLARAEIFAGPLNDRGAAKAELEAILQKEPEHARAIARLADLEQADGNDAAAAELLVRRTAIERSPERLRELFLRLGRIHTMRIPDPKRAVAAYTRVLQIEANNREALDALSQLYANLGEAKNAAAMTERLARGEPSPERRAVYEQRLGHLAERAGDHRLAVQHFRRAVEESPRDVQAMGELVRFLEKTRDAAGRRLVLDQAFGDLRNAVLSDPADASARRALTAVLRWRGRTAAAAAAAELGALLAPAGTEDSRLPDWAAPPPRGRSLAALAKPEVDERCFDPAVPASVRQVFRLVGPLLRDGGRSDAGRLALDRSERVAPGQSPREVFDAVAAELGVGAFDLHVQPTQLNTSPAPLVALPGKHATIIVGARLGKLGARATHFAAARALRLIATQLGTALAGDEAELAAWLGGVVRQFVPDYRHDKVAADVLAARAAQVARALPKRLRQELMPFALESSGEMDLPALRRGIVDGANRVGLVAAGSLAAGLRVVLAIGGKPVSAESIARDPEARALVAFALSDEHDDLLRLLG